MFFNKKFIFSISQLQSPVLQKDLANWSLNNETQVTLIHHVRQENAKVALLSNFIWLRLK